MQAASETQRLLLIDALNVAWWCGKPPSLRLPITLMTQLLQQGHGARLYFDASARYALSHEADLYAALMQHPSHCIEVPSGRSADGVLLREARASGASLVSRDHFRDHRRRYRKLIDDPSRVLAGWVAEDELLLPALTLKATLPASAATAWQRLLPLLMTSAATGTGAAVLQAAS